MSISDKLFERAKNVLPGGVNSPVRAFRTVGGTPRFIAKAKGSTLIDVDGKEYIDYIGSWGPMILGHAHLEVIQAVQRAAMLGTSYGAPCPAEVQLAELIVDRVPSVEKIRFVNSGTEATMSAVRLARAVTGRDLIVKFNGCYHGHADYFLIQAGSGVATLGLPDSPGVTEDSAKNTRSVEYNSPEEVSAVFDAEGGNIAAIIVEPVAGNMGVIPPEDGFLPGLRKLCNRYGSLLIFDEVMTGFRLAPGGAQELFGVKPDITTFGKIIGGGLPVGAYGGKNELMKMIAPEGDVYQAGTLSGNPLAMAAGLKTLQLLNGHIYQGLEEKSMKLETGLKSAAEKARIPVVIQRVGSMLTLFFTDKTVKNMEHAKTADHKRFAEFFNSMLDDDIHLPPSGYEAWFISAAHDEATIEKTIEITEKILKEMQNTE